MTENSSRIVPAPPANPVDTGLPESSGDSVSQGTTPAEVKSHGPARGYSWPTAEPGNTLALRHGAQSRYVITEADELAGILLDCTPHLSDADVPAGRDYCIAQVRAWRFASGLEKHPEDEANTERASRELHRWLSRAEKARARLGLDPMSRAALAVDEITARRNAGLLAREELEEGRRLREQAEARLADANDTETDT